MADFDYTDSVRHISVSGLTRCVGKGCVSAMVFSDVRVEETHRLTPE